MLTLSFVSRFAPDTIVIHTELSQFDTVSVSGSPINIEIQIVGVSILVDNKFLKSVILAVSSSNEIYRGTAKYTEEIINKTL